mmetsp:Transcript_17925/g.27163  ORF Transcript_17925/g.27163 Transcript_17925/m.27163 type:complete len:257 (-) Transcript_17925:1094-1864(-)
MVANSQVGELTSNLPNPNATRRNIRIHAWTWKFRIAIAIAIAFPSHLSSSPHHIIRPMQHIRRCIMYILRSIIVQDQHEQCRIHHFHRRCIVFAVLNELLTTFRPCLAREGSKSSQCCLDGCRQGDLIAIFHDGCEDLLNVRLADCHLGQSITIVIVIVIPIAIFPCFLFRPQGAKIIKLIPIQHHHMITVHIHLHHIPFPPWNSTRPKQGSELIHAQCRPLEDIRFGLFVLEGGCEFETIEGQRRCTGYLYLVLS